MVLPSTDVKTNRVGNGTAYKVFTPAETKASQGMTVGIVWVFTNAATGQEAYMTGCSKVVLDTAP